MRNVCARTALVAIVVGTAGCSVQHVRAQKEMTWACVSELATADRPGYQAVRIRFVDDSHFGEVIVAQGLCDQLTAAGRPIVLVDFDAWGDSRRGLVGFREVAIDGRALIPSSGSTSFSEPQDSNAPTRPHPLSAMFR